MGIYAIIFLCVLLALLLYETVRLVWFLSIARRLGNIHTAFSSHNPESSLRIAVIGDSIAYGVGAEDPRNSLVGRIARDFPEAHIENWSQFRFTLSDIGTALKERAKNVDQKFSHLFVMGGGMDIVLGTSLKEIRRQLEAIRDSAHMMAEEVVIIIPHDIGRLPLFRFPLSGIFSRRAASVRAVYLAFGEAGGVHLIDLYAVTAALSLDRKKYAADFDHPSDEGYGVWYEHIGSAVTAILRPGSRGL